MPKVVGLKDFKDGAPSPEDEAEAKKRNELYVGGIDQRGGGGSGLSVVAPPPDKANSGASSIWEQVKENAQANAAESGSGGHGSSPPPDGTIVITRYRNGYTVNDGTLQAADSPEGIQFFSLLARNLIPKEIAELAGDRVNGREISVSLLDKTNEDWVYKPPPPLEMMRGTTGPTCGSAADDSALVFTAALASLVPAPVLDAAQPSTVIAVKDKTGKSTKIKVNTGVRLEQLGGILAAAGLPFGDNGFTLNTGFPKKNLQAADKDKTLADMGFSNVSMAHILL